MKRRVFVSAMAASLTGCAMGPDFLRPFFETPPDWRVDLPQASSFANMRWWQSFGDPVLDSLVEQALKDNLDIRIAAARVERFLGQLSTTRSQFFPQIGYGLDVSRNRSSERGVTPLPSGTDPWYKLYQGSLSAAWQIDLFGRVRRQSEAAQARVLASEQGRRGTLLSVVSAVAAGYVNLRALDRKLDIARATASNYEKSLRIFELRFKGGVVSQTELSQVESQYQQARAAVPVLEKQVAAQENLLSVLLGRPPGTIPRGKTIDALAVPAVPPGLPSSLIDRRPDVLQAEQNLVAANAEIGVARSLYFPDISLTAAVGSASAALSDFLSGPSTVALLAANIAGPVFTFGNIEGQVRSAEAANAEALANYQLTILNALRDTNDALVGAQKDEAVFDAQSKRVKALREYASLSRLKYENGTASYLEVLYAENELFAAELSGVDAESSRLTQMISVYRALGGGWVDAIDPAASISAEPAAPSADKES
ncbi:MAG: efflux transporter outer membrane subunit [Zoogloeaceae bacterium]|nr:efflux transporter outer membrane subunit [Zoogloeaceae bacterium]